MKTFWKSGRKPILLAAAVILAASVAVGGTVAYLHTKTQSDNNQFHPGVANIDISEPNGSSYSIQDGNPVNKTVAVTNNNTVTPNAVPVYVRVRLVPILRNLNGEGTGEPAAVSYPDLNTINWQQVGDYYYYKTVLYPGKTTENLITKAKLDNGLPDGRKLEIQVIADSIQTEAHAEQNAWGMTFNNGQWQK